MVCLALVILHKSLLLRSFRRPFSLSYTSCCLKQISVLSRLQHHHSPFYEIKRNATKNENEKMKKNKNATNSTQHTDSTLFIVLFMFFSPFFFFSGSRFNFIQRNDKHRTWNEYEKWYANWYSFAARCICDKYLRIHI